MVDVTRNCPNELESIEERRHSLSDGLQVTSRDVLELAVKRGEELDKVFGLSMLLSEVLVDCLEALDGESVY